MILEGCARVLGRDLYHEGISCIEYQPIGIGIDVLTKLADSLGIEWHMVADRDDAGTKYVEAAERQIGTRAKQSHISQLQHGDLEVFLCIEGYGGLYEQYVPPENRVSINAQHGSLAYWQQVTDLQMRKTKVPAALEVIEKMEMQGVSAIPQQLREIIECALELSEEGRDG